MCIGKEYKMLDEGFVVCKVLVIFEKVNLGEKL